MAGSEDGGKLRGVRIKGGADEQMQLYYASKFPFSEDLLIFTALKKWF